MPVSLVKRPTAQGTLWVCHDCTHLAVNGEAPIDRPSDLPEPWAIESAADVTPGLMGTEHPCTEAGTEREHGVVDDCDCETRDFMTSSCDACGDYHAGARHAFTWWQ